MTTDRQSEIRQALRIIGVTDEMAQERAARLGGYSADNLRRTKAANNILTAACMEAWPERKPVTRDTPLGTCIAHDEYGERWLIGWMRDGRMVTATKHDYLRIWATPDGWHVVEDET